MKFQVEINVMPQKALLDPQGKAVKSTLTNVGFEGVESVRIGKHITIEIEAEDKKSAENFVDEACRTILSNPIMESYNYIVTQIEK